MPHEVRTPAQVKSNQRLRNDGTHRFEIGAIPVHMVRKGKSRVARLQPRCRIRTESHVSETERRSHLRANRIERVHHDRSATAGYFELVTSAKNERTVTDREPI